MLGVLLPALSERWELQDGAAGFLFFLQFLGSSIGALLTGANRVRALLVGYGVLVVSAGALVFAGPYLSFVVFFFFGLGLGMAMTATSLLFSDRYGDNRAAILERLNFAWSAGAMAAPMLFLPLLQKGRLSPIFFTFQGLFLLLLIWVFFRERQTTPAMESSSFAMQPQSPVPLLFLLPLMAMAMCSVGVESSLSGWLTTYTHRANPGNLGWAMLATSLFWFGVMLSRLVFSTRLMAILGRRKVLLCTLLGVALSVALLMAAHAPVAIRAASGLAGLCIGPLYPLLLSFILERAPRGWIFFVAGLGSAFFPWMAGLFSAHFGSLRLGLIAPCSAALLMIALLPLTLRSAGSSVPSASPRI
jgi:fucose permease